MQYNRFVFVIFADDLSHHKKLSLHSLPIAYYDFIETEDVDLYTFSKYIGENQPDFHLSISWRHRYAMINHGRINICRRPGDFIEHKWSNEVTEISGQDSNPCSEISLIEYPTALSQAMIIDLEHELNKEIRQRISRDNKISTILK